MMARQRASQARDAFARVGTAPVSAVADDGASIPASENANTKAGHIESISDVQEESRKAVLSDVSRAGGKAAGKAGRPGRRVGRPRGPERVALTVRVLAATDERLTAAVELTGQSPQYLVDAALAAYFDALGV
jgi:hypothetical protein